MVRVLSPLGSIAERSVDRPAYPTAMKGVRVHALDNTKHNAGALLSNLMGRLMEDGGAIDGVLHRKDYAAMAADEQLIEDIVADAELVLVGTAD